ncbi:hypothetical protein [Absidia glauca]|uniref:Heterokaryon incompatibility domain-containing protein n=1 Tax=Absidia glauca TaxID=4829 RepID=A0A168QZ47_ABSGL|nr:hypothetical protein [Absidia glauca]
MHIKEEKEEPFHIVLLDLQEAANKRIHCVQVPFERGHFDLPFIAISYRWGELDEQMFMTGVDYIAHVISFALKDLYKLCKMIMSEPRLKHMKYVWLDAICIDQLDEHRKKTTIYRMTDIYSQANYILAVPDLHYDHIVDDSARSKTSNTLRQHVAYLYYMIKGDLKNMHQFDKEWMDDLGIPQDISFRQGLSSESVEDLNDEIMELDVSGDGVDILATLGHTFEGLKITEKSQSCKLDSRELKFRHLLQQMHLQYKRYRYKKQIDKRWDELELSIDFLLSNIREWTNRTWVINEYHIAKSKGKIMYWFIQFSQDETPLTGLPFFDYDFKEENEPDYPSKKDHYPITVEMFQLGVRFKGDFADELVKRPFLEMILASRAAKPGDRFHAILPLSQYRHVLEHKSTVSSWNITDMASVRQKLLELMTIQDRLNLLYYCSFGMLAPILPSFVTVQGVSTGSGPRPDVVDMLNTTQSKHNFDLDGQHDKASVELDLSQRLPMLRLIPTCFYLHKLRKGDFHYYERWGRTHEMWAKLGLDPDHDPLVEVSLPLILYKPNGVPLKSAYDFTLDLQLVGSLKKNCWVVFRFDRTPNLSGIIFPREKWDPCHLYNDNRGFHVF